jgi:hypothetical protein
MHIKIGFNNRNINAEGIRVYRSLNTPIDTSNLPAPLATIAPTATFYNDETVVKDATYYYVFEVFKGTDTVRTANIKATAVYYTGPGNQTLKGGDLSAGYYGLVSAVDFVDWNTFYTLVGLEPGSKPATVVQEWLKFVYKGKILFVPKQPLGTVAWSTLYSRGLVYGVDSAGPRERNTIAPVNQLKIITIQGVSFKVRLMRGLPEDADLTRAYTAANNTPAVIVSGQSSTILTPESNDSIYDLNGSEWDDLFVRCMSWTSAGQRNPNWDRLDAALAYNGGTSYQGFLSDSAMMEMPAVGQVITRCKAAANATIHPGYCATLSATAAMYWRPVLEMI